MYGSAAGLLAYRLTSKISNVLIYGFQILFEGYFKANFLKTSLLNFRKILGSFFNSYKSQHLCARGWKQHQALHFCKKLAEPHMKDTLSNKQT